MIVVENSSSDKCWLSILHVWKIEHGFKCWTCLGSSPGLVSSAFPCRAAAVRGFPGLGFGACLHFHLQIQIRCWAWNLLLPKSGRAQGQEAKLLSSLSVSEYFLCLISFKGKKTPCLDKNTFFNNLSDILLWFKKQF